MSASTRDIRLPALSATMETATLIEWRVHPGETITEGQAIAEVETDKVDMEVEAPFPGTVVSLELGPGDQLTVGGVMATVASDNEDLLGFLDNSASVISTEAAATPATSAEPIPTRPASEIVKAAPAARRLARENDLDLTNLDPSGNRGEVTVNDVKTRLDWAQPPPSPGPAAPAARRQATIAVVERSAAIPQFTLYRQLDLTHAKAEKLAESWTTIFVRALAMTLRQHPAFNTNWSDDIGRAAPLDVVRVGIAVDRPGVGLTTAAVANPDHGDRAAADRAVRQVIDRARSSKAVPDDLAPAGVTLSNLGGLGVDRFNALLVPQQPAIVSVGIIAMRAVATGGGAIRAALTCEVGLTVDHRAADGADGARFLDTFADLVEQAK